MNRDIEMYDREGVTLRPQRKLFYSQIVPIAEALSVVQVPGLAEKRPSVLENDLVHVRLRNIPEKVFEGRVMVVHQQEVGVAFDKSFHYSARDLCDVKFTINRIPIRRMHQALDAAYRAPRILFPTGQHVIDRNRPTAVTMAAISLNNERIATNDGQLEAVAAILARSPGSVPFIVFGPPGTGKTVTIIEAIFQLVARDPKIRILACASSNSAADHITKGLLNLGREKLFRLNAPFRKVGEVPPDLLPFCYIDRFRRFSVTSAKDLAKFNVVVSTCMSAGIKMPIGHFAYVFIDEAGQAMEPEAMVSIKTMSDDKTQIVLSGDPKQRGPIIHSKVAKRLGFGVSYLERLMQRQIYQVETWQASSSSSKNFRSHEAILNFPNNEFYGGELEACGDEHVINRFLGSPALPNPKFPVVFHRIEGSDDRDRDSPSYFNEAEVEAVTDYVGRFLDDRDYPITCEKIGVIAPYHAQTSKLKARFGALGHNDLEVGSVEIYQGQVNIINLLSPACNFAFLHLYLLIKERDVIILTTVRTDREMVTYDLRHALGFLVDPCRLNVAITRAKSLLIIVGDPRVLSLNTLWRKFMNYIYINGGWRGKEPEWDTAAEVEEDPEAYVMQRQAMQDAATQEQTHRAGKKHKQACSLQVGSQDGRCPDCDVDVPGGQAGWLAHVGGERHKKRIGQAAQPGQSALYCDACKRQFAASSHFAQHMTTSSHKSKMILLAAGARLKVAGQDKFSVVVLPNDSVLDFDIIDATKPPSQWLKVASMTIKVESDDIRLASIRFSSSRGHPMLPIQLNPYQDLQLPLLFRAHNERGHFSARVELDFENTELHQRFTIARSARAIVGVRADYELLRPTAPYVGLMNKKTFVRREFVAGPPRSVNTSIPYYRKLGEYPLDQSVVTTGPAHQRLETLRMLLPWELNSVTYAQHWHTLLHVEEEQSMPGTGKTVTMVEAILQLVLARPTVRILACAPSNSAADLIAEKLIALGPQRLFRLHAPFRLTGAIPAALIPFSYVDHLGRFAVRSNFDLATYNVVVSTCMMAGLPFGIGMPTGHFSHIFIDEAGQAMEPEVMVPIKSIANNWTNVILSGDPNQLGPIIRSALARPMGLGLSFLERLMKRDLYSDRRWHGVSVIKLVKNFRSHPSILDFSNRQFYRNELQIYGDPQRINRFIGSLVLPNPKFPLIFHSVSGVDDREANSPSYFNIAEISIVADYIQKLVGDLGYPMRPEEIGVITPYRAQSAKLLVQFGGRYPNLKVGSVEEYQGQERDVMIITTVRADREQVSYDLRHTLGFLVNPRRLNVAVTRAKGLLIIVGDPHVLGLDPLWRKLLNYLHVNGGWTGTQPDWDTSAAVADDPGTYVQQRQAQRDADMEELTDRLMKSVLGGGSIIAGGVGSGQQRVEEEMDASGDRPWREYD
ncbi:hypothetical protein FRB96_008013 [Tulasnella sp. 330]|nr:hypothetical protein FRB96_008013 [Tulasnella sp. 330]